MVNVAVIPCNSYQQEEVDKAVKKAFSLIKIPNNKTVLLKPNLLGTYKRGSIVTTNPAVVDAVCKILKHNHNKILIGDSSFEDTARAIKKSGILKVAKKYNAQVINFDRSKQCLVRNAKAKILKKFYLPSEILKADYIISLPKLKTHTLTKLTCAVKNSFGMIAGAKKQYYHKLANTEGKFCQLLLDIYQKIKPDFVIVDAVVGMDGEGPSSGTAKRTNLILASENPIALDIIASKIIGWDPKSVLTNKIALNKKIFKDKIKVIGKLKTVRYEKPSIHKLTGMSLFLANMLAPRKITVYKSKCIKCGKCARRCPVKAITLKPYPKVNRRKCIRCYCCIEVCPQHALYIKSNIIRKLLAYIRRVMYGL